MKLCCLVNKRLMTRQHEASLAPSHQICHGNIQSEAENVGERGKEQRVVLNSVWNDVFSITGSLSKKCIICGLYQRKYGYTSALCRLQIKLTVQPLPITSVTTEDQSNYTEEMRCTSLHLLLFDNAGTRWWLGGARCPVQQTICNHTDLPVGLLGGPLSSQATAHNGRQTTP